MKKFKKIIAMCLATVMAMSVMCVGVFANTGGQISPLVHYGTKPNTEAALPFNDSMNGVNSETGMGYSDFYFSCGSAKKVILDMSAVYVQSKDAGASVTMTIRDQNNDALIKRLTFTTNSSGEIDDSLKYINFVSENTKFYVQIETNPSDVHFYGQYRLTY